MRPWNTDSIKSYLLSKHTSKAKFAGKDTYNSKNSNFCRLVTVTLGLVHYAVRQLTLNCLMRTIQSVFDAAQLNDFAKEMHDYKILTKL